MIGHKIRAAVIFLSYGPYHLARAMALANSPDVDPVFVELCSSEDARLWRADKSCLNGRLKTVAGRPFEECSQRELAGRIQPLLDELDPQVIAVAGYSLAAMRAAARWARRRGRAVVMMGDSTEVDLKRRWWRELVKRRFVSRNCHAAFVAGQSSREYFRKLGVPAGAIWDGYDVVDNAHFAQRSDAARVQGRAAAGISALPERYFLYVGRFAPEKNLSALLRAYGQYRRDDRDGWGLVLVGSGEEEARLRALEKEESLPELVWPGFVQTDRLPVYYAFAGCFILPSVREPWGLVVNEAMACGLPVLASRRCGSAADLIVEGTNGFTFDPADRGELARLMALISSMPDTDRDQMGAESRRIIANWTPEAWASQLTCALHSALR